MKKLLTMMVAAFFGCSLFGALTDGLVAHYKFDGNANDSSGNGNNGVVQGATLATDRFGNPNGAYSFDGDDWIQVANSASLSLPTKAMSFCVWMRTEVEDGWVPFLSKGTSSRQYGFELGYGRETTLFINDYNGTGCGQDVFVAVDSVSLNSGAWHFVVLTYDGNEIKAYANGNLIASRAVEDSFVANSSDLYIGKDVLEATDYFSGAMDDLRIYNRVLSTAEVKALYEGNGAPVMTKCAVTFDAAGGTAEWTKGEVVQGAAIGTLPTVTREGYEFLGWFTAADGGTQVTAATVVTADATFYAQWKAQVPDIAPKEDQPMDAGIANVYDGVITDADGLPIGSVNVKAGKISNAGVSKVTATIQMAGESKKVTIKGEVKVSDAVMTAVAKDGRKLDLMFLRNSISGTFDGYLIEGTRNLLSSSGSSAEKSAAEVVINRLVGNYTIAYGDEQGWNGLSLAVMKKGKCKISGKLANGKGVATTSQMIVGEDYCCLPVICSKKDVELSLGIYFPNNGKEPFVFGFYNAVIASVTELGSGLTFRMGGGIYDPLDMYEIEDGYLPEGVSVEQRGTKWIVAGGVKPGKIKMDREEGVYDANESENPSGLKLTFTAKTGLFKGSFKVYGINDMGKLKSFTATVNGIVVDGRGYGTATVKKFGSVAVTIE